MGSCPAAIAIASSPTPISPLDAGTLHDCGAASIRSILLQPNQFVAGAQGTNAPHRPFAADERLKQHDTVIA
jgi:hypothetical protein